MLPALLGIVLIVEQDSLGGAIQTVELAAAHEQEDSGETELPRGQGNRD